MVPISYSVKLHCYGEKHSGLLSLFASYEENIASYEENKVLTAT
jgi:hypothetical protein